MAIVQQDVSRTKAGEPTLAEKVAFLSQPAAYPRPVSEGDPPRNSHVVGLSRRR